MAATRFPRKSPPFPISARPRTGGNRTVSQKSIWKLRPIAKSMPAVYEVFTMSPGR